MASRSLILLLAVSFILMTMVVADYYENGVKKYDEDQFAQHLTRYFGRPRSSRSNGWMLDKRDQDYKDVEQPEEDPPSETRLVRASRLNDLHSLDSFINLHFKPRFGKRTYMHKPGPQLHPVTSEDYTNKWIYILGRR